MGEDAAPRITIKPNLKQEDNGNKLVFHCQIEASPQPDIKWLKESAQIASSERINFKIDTVDGRLFNLYLELDNVTSDDSGQYKVVAKNRLGEVSASIALNFAGIYFC